MVAWSEYIVVLGGLNDIKNWTFTDEDLKTVIKAKSHQYSLLFHLVKYQGDLGTVGPEYLWAPTTYYY